jgi:capsule biosynthesis phosphatase
MNKVKKLRICLDIDGTICTGISEGRWYDAVEPFEGVVEFLQQLKAEGHYLILQTARHMRTCSANEGRVLAMGGKLLFDWLEKWKIPYDEVYFGKPHADIFIDDAGYQHTNWKDTKRAIADLADRGGRFPETH